METGHVTVRLRDGRNLPSMSPGELIDRIRGESEKRR